MIGTDEERVLYTQLMNRSLKEKCIEEGFTFFNYYDDYARLDGTLKFELSDGICHIKDNSMLLEKLEKIL